VTYRAPAFAITHSVATRTIPSITTPGGTYLSDPHKRALIDFRVADFATYNSTLATAVLQVDMGSAYGFNRMVIPFGHNLATHNILIESDTNSGFTTPTFQGSLLVPSILPIDLSLVGTPAERYWRMTMTLSPSIAPSFSEWWLAGYVQLSADAYVDQGFENGYISPVIRTEYPSGTATLALSTARRRFSLVVRNLDSTGADYNALSAVLRLGHTRPFWYWPPDTADAGPFFVQLDVDGTRVQEFKAPTARTLYQIEFAMTETAL
jgi:hypothetical protein